MYIENQNELQGKGLGKYPAYYNSCAPVAIYNMCNYYNLSIDYETILRWCNNIVDFKGMFGMSPKQVKMVIQQICIRCSIELEIWQNLSFRPFESIKDHIFFNPINGRNCSILMYWAGKGIHYAFMDDTGKLHNSYGKTICDLYQEMKLPILLLAIHKLS